VSRAKRWAARTTTPTGKAKHRLCVGSNGETDQLEQRGSCSGCTGSSVFSPGCQRMSRLRDLTRHGQAGKSMFSFVFIFCDGTPAYPDPPARHSPGPPTRWEGLHTGLRWAGRSAATSPGSAAPSTWTPLPRGRNRPGVALFRQPLRGPAASGRLNHAGQAALRVGAPRHGLASCLVVVTAPARRPTSSGRRQQRLPTYVAKQVSTGPSGVLREVPRRFGPHDTVTPGD
jgi:hypothetical protein